MSSAQQKWTIYPKGSPPRRPGTETQSSSSSSRGQSKYVATACESCKRVKRKCDGKLPCQTCSEKGIQCIYDESKDGRRGRKRTLHDLHAKAQALDTVLHAIRENTDHDLVELMRLIRNDAPVDELAACARAIPEDKSRQGLHDRIRSDVMRIANLTDAPILRVPAQPWTTVTSNDDFVSHLISIFFTWHIESYPCVDKDVFIQAMTSGDTNSLFCSPFLVNCLLLTACIYSDHPLVFAFERDKSTRGLHFAEEVARLWAEEEGRVTLTNLQGLVALSMGLGLIQKDRQALIYVRTLPIVCTDLARKIRRLIKQGHLEFTTEVYQQSLCLARWSAFQMEVDFSLIWVKPMGLAKPGAARPYSDEEQEVTQIWSPYPSTGAAIWFNPAGLRAAKLALREIGAEIIPVMLNGEPDDSPMPGHVILNRTECRRRLEELYARLHRWRMELPSYATINTATTPSWSLVELHLIWHDYCIVVCGLMLSDSISAGSRRQEAKAGLLKHCEGVAEIFQWAQSTLGSATTWCPWTFQAAVRAAYPLAELLSEAGVADTFHTIIARLSSIAKRWLLARGVLKMLWIMLQEHQQLGSLLPETTELLRANGVDNWGPDDHRLFAGCLYPNYTVLNEKGRELADMGELLEQWSHFNLSEENVVDAES